MKFVDIGDESKVYPGEYLLYEPKQIIVLCGAFNRADNKIKAFGQGNYIVDTINAFKKIEIKSNQHRQQYRSRCKGCGG